jgi:hypothetical protein
MLSIYRWLLHLYPAAYREEFGDEMEFVLAELHQEHRRQVAFRRALVIIRETTGLLRGAMEEHWRRLGDVSYDASLRSRRFVMSSGFRFPKSTVALMAVILAGTILAIEKCKSIVDALHKANPQSSPLDAEQITVFGAFAVIFIVVAVLAAIGWAVLFAMGRSGVHRLSQISAGSNRDSAKF